VVLSCLSSLEAPFAALVWQAHVEIDLDEDGQLWWDASSTSLVAHFKPPLKILAISWLVVGLQVSVSVSW
jgi:hypothetical protein